MARRAERDERRLERDGGERAHDEPERRAVDLCGDEGHAGGEPAEGGAQAAVVEVWRDGLERLGGGMAQRRAWCAAERDVADEVVRAVGAERMHEAAGADVAVGAGERVAVEVAGAAGQRERAVDDPRGGLVDERLRGLRLGEQRDHVRRSRLVDERRAHRDERRPRRRRGRSRSRRRSMRVRASRLAARAAHRWRPRRALGDAQRRRGVEEPGDEVALHVRARRRRPGTRRAARRAGSSTPSNVTEWLPDARMPSASQSSWTTTPGASVGTCA